MRPGDASDRNTTSLTGGDQLTSSIIDKIWTGTARRVAVCGYHVSNSDGKDRRSRVGIVRGEEVTGDLTRGGELPARVQGLGPACHGCGPNRADCNWASYKEQISELCQGFLMWRRTNDRRRHGRDPSFSQDRVVSGSSEVDGGGT
jgi:hypothetical protein